MVMMMILQIFFSIVLDRPPFILPSLNIALAVSHAVKLVLYWRLQ